MSTAAEQKLGVPHEAAQQAGGLLRLFRLRRPLGHLSNHVGDGSVLVSSSKSLEMFIG